jgi:AcrR family transcriptional regulator
MTAAQPTDIQADKADPRLAILQAAAERILHYGYNKTTMSEIASDCGMSAGNIYRFYPSKIDIAEAMTRNFNGETHSGYMEILRDAGRSPSRKLRDFFAFRLERTFRTFEKHPKLMELAEIMARERPEFLAEEHAQERIQIEKILEEGQISGDFAPPGRSHHHGGPGPMRHDEVPHSPSCGPLNSSMPCRPRWTGCWGLFSRDFLPGNSARDSSPHPISKIQLIPSGSWKRVPVSKCSMKSRVCDRGRSRNIERLDFRSLHSTNASAIWCAWTGTKKPAAKPPPGAERDPG